MYKRTRYFLITLGFIVFFVLAPLIVFYINGLRFGLGGNSANYEQTGILVAKTEPKGAQVFLNGKLADTTPATIRFLNAGEYLVRIHSYGYRDWTKRLEVKAGKVTWANLNLDKIKLLKADPVSQTISSQVLDFALAGNRLFYLTGKNLVIASVDNPGQTENLVPPKPVNKIVGLGDSNFYLLRGDKTSLVFSLDAKQFSDISNLVTPQAHLEITPDNNLLVLEQNKLYEVDFSQHKKTLLSGNIIAFTLLNGDLYYVRADHGINSLLVAPLASFQQSPDTVLLTPVPAAQSTEIIATPQKEIALILDHALYRLNNQLERVADGLIDWNLNPGEDILALTRAGELDYYAFGSNDQQLITRAAGGISNARVLAGDGYAFFITENRLQALEIDNRDRQNDYVLTANIKNGAFVLNNGADKLFLLNNGNLTSLKIR